jgi:hypothetical protein
MAKGSTLAAPKQRSRTQIKRILSDAFREKFPHDTVDVSDGVDDLIHVLVVSRQFDKMTPKQQDELMWRIVDRAPLTGDEKGLVSLIHPLSPRQLK